MGWHHTPETRARLSAAMRAIRAADSPEQRERRKFKQHTAETRAKLSTQHMGMRHTPEARAKMRVAKAGTRHSLERRAHMSQVLKGHPAHFPKRRFYYKDIPFRSSWEVRCAQALDALSIPWQYEPRRFDLGEQTYTPDFYLPDDNAFWEVKGYLGPKSQRTIALFRAWHPEIPLVLVNKECLHALEQSASWTT